MLDERFIHPLGLESTALVLISVGLLLLLSVTTRIRTEFAYRRAVAKAQNSSNSVGTPPLLPYWIPWLGHTLRFFEQTAKRWDHRQRQHLPPDGVYSMLIASRRTHIVTNPVAVRHLFRHAYTGGLSREGFVADLLVKCLQVSPHDTSIINTGQGRKRQEEVFQQFLGRREAVSELTTLFTKQQSQCYNTISIPNNGLQNVSLYAWLRKHTISSSLTAFFGEELLQLYPEITNDIFLFDEDLCTFFFGLPRALNRAAWARRQRMLDHLMRWESSIRQSNKSGTPEDPTGAGPWDPVFGSRFNKARLRLYDEFGLDPSSRAGMNLSIMFALASNVIPAVGWMMFHIIASPERERLLKTVRGEANQATRPDGTLDISLLLSASPLLQSIWTEVIRHYCDNMIMRDVVEDTVVALDEDNLRGMAVKKGDLIISPCWIAHHEEKNWKDGVSSLSADVFDPERFLGTDLSQSKRSALAGTPTATMYPFGGGKSVCAGRNFAKAEAIITVAQTLSKFDFELNGFQDGKGQPISSFPDLTPSLPGTVIYVPRGDVSVTIRKRVKMG